MAKKRKVSESGRKYVERTIKPRSMDEGEVLEARVLSIVQGALSPILQLVDGNGEIHRLWMSTVLEQAITLGDIGRWVRIEYKGEVKSASGRPVRDYDVGVADADSSAN